MTRVAAAALLAAGVAGCSGDLGRFGAEPFANPYSKADATPTGSLPPRAGAGVGARADGDEAVASPSSRVVSAPLAAPTGAPRSTGSLAAPRGAENIASPNAVSGGTAGWSAQGGSRVTLGEGESVDALSGRFGVPSSAILAANGLAKASDARPGQALVIPVYSAGGAGAAPAPRAPAKVAAVEPVRAAEPIKASEPAKARTRPGMVRQEAAEPARAARPKLAAKPADDEDEPAAKPAKPKLAAKPEPKAAEAPKTAEAPKPAKVARVEPKAAEPKAAEPKLPEVKPVAAAKPAKAEAARAPEPAKAEPAPATTASLPEAKAAPEFRWPARGRVIAGYGAKTGAGSNDGVNIALPEGTAVKAAEAGTVAYAGEELKGYGKLVLVRHADGWVSAYANNGELNVKRGDVIKRGQVVAKSGATGNVSSPQLHFELRKGSTPVDPTKYLDAN